nr:hypothetical protein [Tanacetum cinerariifolium]
RLPFYYAPPAAPDAVIPRPTQEDLAAATPSTKVLAKAEASKKRTASTFRAAPSQVAKRTSDGEESDDDDDACVKISLITPIRFAATIPVGGNQSRGLVPSATEDSTSGAISRDFSLFALGPYYATYPKDGVVVGSYEVSREEWDDQYQPNLSILTKGVFKDPNAYKTVVNKFPTPGEMDIEILWLKSSPPEFSSFFKGGFQSLVQKFLASDEFKRVQEQLVAALNKIFHFVLGAYGRLIKVTPLIATTDYLFLNKVANYSAHPMSAIMELEPDRLACTAVVPTPKVVGVSPLLLKELTVKPALSLVRGARGMPENITCCSELGGTPTVDWEYRRAFYSQHAASEGSWEEDTEKEKVGIRNDCPDQPIVINDKLSIECKQRLVETLGKNVMYFIGCRCVVTDGPMEEALKSLGTTRRLALWAAELRTYHISYIQRKEAEGQTVKRQRKKELQVPSKNNEGTSGVVKKPQEELTPMPMA